MKLKIETVELKHKNIYGKKVVERKVYYLIRTSLFGFRKRYLDFGGILSYWSHSAISAVLGDHTNLLGNSSLWSLKLRKHKLGVAYFDRLEDANAVLKKIKDNPDKFIIK